MARVIRTALATTVGMVLLGVAVQAAPGPKKVTRLGNPHSSFLKPAPGKDVLQTPDDLRRLLRGHLDDVMVVVGKAAAVDAGLAPLTREALDAGAQRGEIGEKSFEPGSILPWMAYRKKDMPEMAYDAAGLLWAGKKPFDAYVLTFETRDATTVRHWTLTAPRACGNFWVTVSTETIPPPKVAVSTGSGSACYSLAVPVTVELSQLQPGDQVVISVDGRTAESFAGENGSHKTELRSLAVGTHTVDAKVTREGGPGAEASANATIQPCPPSCALASLPAKIRTGHPLTLDASGSRVNPGLEGSVRVDSVAVQVQRDGVDAGSVTLSGPGFTGEYVPQESGEYTFQAVVTDSVGQKSSGSCSAGPVQAKAFPFFVGGYFGKERLVRSEFNGGRCAALLGAKVGVLPEIADNVEFEAAVGGKLNLRDSGNSSMFIDAAVNRVLSKGFIGVGLSAWDLTISDTRTVGALIHGGIDLDQRGRFGIEVEGRLPLDQFSDLDNNYQFWGGIRIRPGR